MQIVLPREVIFILHTLEAAGFQAYIVGGAVRDLLLAAQENSPALLNSIDYDFTTDATPEEIQALFPESFYENTFGTVAIAPTHLHEMMGIAPTASETTESVAAKTIDLSQATKVHVSLQLPSNQTEQTVHEPPFEITTFRSDGLYTDHRRPETVTWGKTIEEDLARRDFTINAMAIRLAAGELSELLKNTADSITLTKDQYELIDLYQGQRDLADFKIKTVGEAHERFREDALRMLRAIRLSVQLNMSMSDDVFAAISALAEDIQHVSWERVSVEFMKMLKSNYPAEAIELLDETGLLHFILPELREGKGIQQGGHHTTDVWTHSIDALRSCPSTDPIVRFATLLHDVAKPRTFKLESGKPTFYNHEIVGAKMARSIAQRFRLSKHDIDRMYALVRYHMFYYQPENTDAAIRRFMRKVGLQNINDILDLREADRLGSGARKTSWRLEEMKDRMIEQLHQPFSVTDLAIDGNDLMEEFKLKPGPILGKLLRELFEKVLENPEMNTKEKLTDEAKQLLKELQ